ncbi:hypothetical protein HLH36_07405 [Gluconacetobacter aggeris]|uniref:Uncharacterized protein n=1 Tax=Gluconacetobacter aggeris TaxID=1286186 RepID=A0A7W4NZ13_9PROT|nr:hypothetical protein [Gluconacetobacter aggeris]MBB2168180.1 hypothetical protein [Gluconacetobacter aggeris]
MMAPAMASAMVRTHGKDAIAVVRRHIARSLEDNLVDDVEFWLRVRDQIECLQWSATWAGQDRRRPAAGDGRPGEEVVLEAWLKETLCRMAGSAVDEPIPEALLRLVGLPIPEGDPE